MSTIYFGCTMLSPTTPWIQLRLERDCTHSPMSPLGTSVMASPCCAGRGQPNGWGQAAPGVCCGGNDCHKVRFYPCRCESCFISCTTSSLHEAVPNSSLPPQLPLASNQTIYLGPKPAFKCLTSETPACDALLKHFHHRNLHNLQSQQ